MSDAASYIDGELQETCELVKRAERERISAADEDDLHRRIDRMCWRAEQFTMRQLSIPARELWEARQFADPYLSRTQEQIDVRWGRLGRCVSIIGNALHNLRAAEEGAVMMSITITKAFRGSDVTLSTTIGCNPRMPEGKALVHDTVKALEDLSLGAPR